MKDNCVIDSLTVGPGHPGKWQIIYPDFFLDFLRSRFTICKKNNE